MEEMIHYGPPPGSSVLLLLLILVPLFLLYLYLIAAFHRRKSSGWSGWRTASFSMGIMLTVIAVLPPIASWAHHDLRGHMLQHLLLGMFGPLALVFGAPGTLLVRSLSGAIRPHQYCIEVRWRNGTLDDKKIYIFHSLLY